ncbi:hypothetical Protein YC6258_00492 [Gynuella sunshinyii YC6258]|uniref:Uncharacterized protein n=1 Tax=Gynuella sunshinyii YC6258 TaxID=1445510 RepID=A0A0C5VEA0_9GAMM|nr:hypothetical Protein YC6258_00492 [Gynuella sunshinyii YC6258]
MVKFIFVPFGNALKVIAENMIRQQIDTACIDDHGGMTRLTLNVG